MKTKQFNPAGKPQIPQYKKPKMEIIQMESEGILCASGTTDTTSPGGGWSNF